MEKQSGAGRICERGFLLCISTLLWIYSNAGRADACTKDESAGLLRFKTGLLNGSQSYLENWIEGSDCCSWRGVTCSNETRSVIELDLQGGGLESSAVDTFSSIRELCALNQLQSLSASNNQLTGALPNCIGNLTSLSTLSLSSSGLTGKLPSSMRLLSQLSSLDLSINRLEAIPEWIGNLSLLSYVDLSTNSLVGSIPDSLGHLAELTTLYLYDNQLGGELPTTLGSLPVLEEFMLQRNRLTGRIPSSLGNISAASGGILFDFLLTSNDLSGPIPASIGNLSVTSFSLSGNRLSGPIPSSFRTLTSFVMSFFLDENLLTGQIPQYLVDNSANMIEFSIASNLLTGRVPSFSGNSSQLVTFNISGNNLTGPIPTLPSVFSLDLSSNGFTGPFPSALLENFTVLEHVNFQSNQLVGTIPPSFGLKCWKLRILSLGLNRLSGDLTSSFSNLTALKFIDLSANNFSGQVPTFENSSMVEKVKLGNNSFEGVIPESFSTLRSLQSLYVKNNKLRSPLPSLKNCPNLTVVDATANQFTGTVPSWLEGVSSSLRILMLGSNDFEGEFPVWLTSFTNLQVLDLSNNKITGTLPADLNRLQGYKNEGGNDTSMNWKPRETLYEDEINVYTKGYLVEYTYILSSVTSFDVSHNSLDGPIPSQFGDLLGLRFLNLTSNRLSGSIPSSVGKMAMLESLDLSFNNLSGSIPVELTSITFLSAFDVSYNQLSGPIPHTNQFLTFPNSSYLGNPGLCGVPLQFCIASVPSVLVSPAEEKDGFDDWVGVPGIFVGFALGFAATWIFIFVNKRARNIVFGQIGYRETELQSQEGKRRQYGAYLFPE